MSGEERHKCGIRGAESKTLDAMKDHFNKDHPYEASRKESDTTLFPVARCFDCGKSLSTIDFLCEECDRKRNGTPAMKRHKELLWDFVMNTSDRDAVAIRKALEEATRENRDLQEFYECPSCKATMFRMGDASLDRLEVLIEERVRKETNRLREWACDDPATGDGYFRALDDIVEAFQKR